MGIPNFREWRERCEQMKAQKDTVFPVDSVVRVESERFHGIGIVSRDESCPIEKLVVRVESLNVWWYPIEDCAPYHGRMPSWMRGFLRSHNYFDKYSALLMNCETEKRELESSTKKEVWRKVFNVVSDMNYANDQELIKLLEAARDEDGCGPRQ